MASNKYFSVLISYTPDTAGDRWCPANPIGPFSTLTRGAFDCPLEAVRWALNNLPFDADWRIVDSMGVRMSAEWLQSAVMDIVGM